MNNRPEIVLVVAVAANDVIGQDNGLPWHLPVDLKRFKSLTVGKPVIMGRKTYESIGRPLPGRHNIVLTRSADWSVPGVTVVPNLAEAIAAAGLDPRARASEIMVIGGAEIFREAMPISTRIELTEVESTPEGDTFFPPFDRNHWREVHRERHPAEDGRPAFSFVTLERA